MSFVCTVRMPGVQTICLGAGAGHNSKCRYTVATALWLRDYLNKNNFTDATDWNGENFLKAYSIKMQKPVLQLLKNTGKKSDADSEADQKKWKPVCFF